MEVVAGEANRLWEGKARKTLTLPLFGNSYTTKKTPKKSFIATLTL